MTTDHTSDIPLFPCALVAVLRAADSCRFGVTIAAAIDVGGDSCASAASVLLEPAVPIDGAGRRQRTRSSLTMQRAVRFRIIGSCERCTQQYFIGQQACRSGCERDAHIFSSRVGVTFCQGNALPLCHVINLCGRPCCAKTPSSSALQRRSRASTAGPSLAAA